MHRAGTLNLSRCPEDPRVTGIRGIEREGVGSAWGRQRDFCRILNSGRILRRYLGTVKVPLIAESLAMRVD